MSPACGMHAVMVCILSTLWLLSQLNFMMLVSETHTVLALTDVSIQLIWATLVHVLECVHTEFELPQNFPAFFCIHQSKELCATQMLIMWQLVPPKHYSASKVYTAQLDVWCSIQKTILINWYCVLCFWMIPILMFTCHENGNQFENWTMCNIIPMNKLINHNFVKSCDAEANFHIGWSQNIYCHK